ncbi:MAG TPA: thermonuclease family protein [Vicinamibacterales bacterium]|jgi:endonuclease YncB( thermonuclease family)
MQFLCTATLIGAALLQTLPQGGFSQPLLVTAIVDGGAIDVQTIGRVRLLGIAAPRIDRRTGQSAPHAIEARDRLSALVGRRWVRLQYDAGAKAAVSTRSAYILLGDGTCVNVALVREGLARVTAQRSLSRFAELQEAQEEAERSQIGIWSPFGSSRGETYKTPKAGTRQNKKKSGGG